MFFIVWRGWGILVPVMAVGVFIFGAIVESSGLNFGLERQQAILFGEVIGSLIAGAGLFFIARKIESEPGRTLIDAATNQRIVFKKNAGSFFFIPTRYWAFILPCLMALLAVSAVVSPRHTAAALSQVGAPTVAAPKAAAIPVTSKP